MPGVAGSRALSGKPLPARLRRTGVENKLSIKHEPAAIPDALVAVQNRDVTSDDTSAHTPQRSGSDKLQLHLGARQQPALRFNEGATAGQIDDPGVPPGKQARAGHSFLTDCG